MVSGHSFAPAVKLTRPPNVRMQKIYLELKEGGRVNCTTLSNLLGVSTKTVARDIAFMRDQMRMPIDYDQMEFSYSLTTEIDNFPLVEITEGEMFSLLVAQKALEQYAGTPYQAPLANAFQKLTAGLNDVVTFSADSGLSAISFHNQGIGKFEIEIFNTLERAVRQLREITFQYRKPGPGIPEARRVHPYHITNRENLWYMIGFDLDRNDYRTFAIPRMSDLKFTDKIFEKRSDFSPEKYFEKSFGPFVGKGDYEVKIRFDAENASRICERTWHQCQKITYYKNGTIDFCVRLGSLSDIERWILSWGPHAKVLAPAELRSRIKDTLRIQARQYGLKISSEGARLPSQRISAKQKSMTGQGTTDSRRPRKRSTGR